MPLPVSAWLSLPEAIRLVIDATGEDEDRVRAALIEAGLTGATTATGCRHSSAHPNPARYFAHPVLTDRETVPSSAWATAISWPESRVGRYDLVRFDRADIERWLALAATDQQSASVAEPEASATPSGIRTNRAAAAEEACQQWLSTVKERPANKEAAFEAAKDAVAKTGPLSRKAFERAWAAGARVAWKKPGRRRS
jgi:hypothetical protein